MEISLRERTVEDVLMLVTHAHHLNERTHRIAIEILTSESEKGHAQQLLKSVNWNYVDNRFLDGLENALELSDSQNPTGAH
jgi:hypothetical protein